MTDHVRTVPPSERSAGLTEITRRGRSFAIASTTPEAVEQLRKHVDEKVGPEDD